MGVIVLAPSRGRPVRALEMAESLVDTRGDPGTRLVVAVDESDPTRQAYGALRALPGVDVVVLWGDETGDLARATNSAARRLWSGDSVLGHVGDDHLFRTPGWDLVIAAALREPGLAYGDDLLQGARLPTACFMSSRIPRALGWMALPACRHLYIDDTWKRLGEGLGRLHYLPDVVIEHMHPAAGKARSDAGYERWNDEAAVRRDREAFERWEETRMAEDVERVRAAL